MISSMTVLCRILFAVPRILENNWGFNGIWECTTWNTRRWRGGLNSISSKEYGLIWLKDFTSIKWPEIQALTKLVCQRRCYCKIDEQNISSFADLSGYINTKRPNDKVQVTYSRDGKTKAVPVTLSKMNF
jgi:hypothetical protein